MKKGKLKVCKVTQSVILSETKDPLNNALGNKLNYKGFFATLRMTNVL